CIVDRTVCKLQSSRRIHSLAVSRKFGLPETECPAVVRLIKNYRISDDLHVLTFFYNTSCISRSKRKLNGIHKLRAPHISVKTQTQSANLCRNSIFFYIFFMKISRSVLHSKANIQLKNTIRRSKS